MTNKWKVANLSNIPADDMPFGIDGERRRIALEKAGEKQTTLVAEIRDEIRQQEQQGQQCQNQ